MDEDEMKKCTEVEELAEDGGRVEAAPNKAWRRSAR